MPQRIDIIKQIKTSEVDGVFESPYPPGLWSLNGELLREDGTREWWSNGELHREDGPAIEFADGTTMWFTNGKLHREDGPAVERGNGLKRWWRNGKPILTPSAEPDTTEAP
jgi:hypothetical protein